jgi:hypothetical protein
LKYAREAKILPVWLDILKNLDYKSETLANTINVALRSGRSYLPFRLWRKVEFQLANALGKVAAEVIANPTADVASIVNKNVVPLAHLMNISLQN